MSDSWFAKKGVSLDRLWTLVAIHDAGSIALAADRDATRQSLMSRQLLEIEAGLGVSLVDRSTSPHRLTRLGEQLAEEAARFVRRVEQNLQDSHGQLPSVRVGAGESVIQWLILPRLKEQRSWEGLRVQFQNLTTRSIIEGVRRGTLDCGFVANTEDGAGLEFVALARYGVRRSGVPRLSRGAPQIRKTWPMDTRSRSWRDREGCGGRWTSCPSKSPCKSPSSAPHTPRFWSWLDHPK